MDAQFDERSGILRCVVRGAGHVRVFATLKSRPEEWYLMSNVDVGDPESTERILRVPAYYTSRVRIDRQVDGKWITVGAVDLDSVEKA